MASIVTRNVLLVVSVLLTIHCGTSKEHKIPSYIEVCKRNDPHVEDCILNSVERLRPTLLKGIPELEVPPLDPLLIPEIRITLGQSQRPGFRAVGHDVLVHGAKDFKVTSLKVDLDTHTFLVGLEIPELYFVATYDISARFAMLPVKGRGPIHANATDIKGDLVLNGELQTRDGEEYLHFKSIEVDLRIGDFHVHIENLFRGDTILTEATNAAINGNSQEFLQSFLPVVEENVGIVLLNIANKITHNLKYDEVFPKE